MIPCKYLVARFVEDEIRDESINIGLILQSQQDFQTLSKFNELRDPSRYSSLKIALLKEMVSKICSNLKNRRNNKYFFSELEKYDRILLFTEPRPVITSNLKYELDRLFNVYISRMNISEKSMLDVDTV